MTKILLIEDNQQIAANIKEYLETEDGREVQMAGDGEAGLMKAKLYDYDIILLDLMLPKISGENLYKTLKKSKSTPVIITSAKSQLENKLELFDIWADDYLVKPFDLEELLVRIKAVLRRGVISSVFEWGNIVVDLDKKEVKKAGEIVNLTLKEFQILELLIKNEAKSVSRTDIMSEIWGGDSIWESENENKLDVYISTVRRKLGKDLIKTVKWFGYSVGNSE